MKNRFLLKLFALAMIVGMAFITSCKDYDEDINSLENKIAGLTTTLNDLKNKVDAGAVITKVENTANGVKVTLSDGKTFELTNGKDGIDGKDGKPGTVITANADGFWYIDGKKSEYTWKGEKGDTGAPGADGKDGAYFEPDPDGFWYKVEGEKRTKTDKQWLLPGVITAVMNEMGDVTFNNVKSGDATNSITIYNNKLLRSLVLIPHYFVNGIETINFSPIVYASECAPEGAVINPKVLVQYHVNPSSITEEMIDTKNLSFAYQLQKNYFRSAEINPTAKFVSLKDGILTVEVMIDADKAESNFNSPRAAGKQMLTRSTLPDDYYSEIFDMIALQVKLSEKAMNGMPGVDAIVTSDYGRVDVMPMSYPEIDRAGYLYDKDEITYSWDFNTVAKAKEIDKAPYLIEVPYDKEVDLVDYIASVAFPIGDAPIDLAAYGLKYNFDLIDAETDKPIEYIEALNKTDQQEFITVLDPEKGTIKSKVYTGAGTAAIGRTPLVRVQLIDTQNENCVVTYGYIKIKFIKDVPALEKDYAETVNYNCDETKIGIDEPWMNLNIYNAMKMSSAEFHTLYYLDEDGVYDANGVLVPELGKIENLWDFFMSGQTTDLFNWIIDKTAIVKANSKVFTGYVYYRSKADNSVGVKIKVTATVTMPQLTVYGHNLTYWVDSSYKLYKVNPIVYGNDEANPTANIWANMLNGFLDKDGKFTNDETMIIKSSIPGFVPANVTFEFDGAKLGQYKYYIGTTEYSVAKKNLKLSENKQELIFVIDNKEVVAATIVKDEMGYRIILNENGTEALEPGSALPTEAAKALVGKKVPVKINADLCGEGEVVQSVKEYEVTFIEPIKIDAKITGDFTDAVIGGSRIDVATGLTFTDWNNYAVREKPFDKPTEKQKYASELYTYYVLEEGEWDIAKAKTNLKLVDGNLVPTEGYKDGAMPENYVLKYDAATKQLVFYNNSGSPVNNEFIIYVPVSVGHKWGTASATVAILVKKAEGTGN